LRVLEQETLKAKRKRTDGKALKKPAPSAGLSAGKVEPEHARWDPKDSELSVSRTKPEETLVEVRSGYDVQIYRLTCV